MTIANTLTVNNFATMADGSQFWGIGSLVWGHTAQVRAIGDDLYEVTIHHWFYTPDGDPAVEDQKTEVLYGAQVLTIVFTEMPLWPHR